MLENLKKEVCIANQRLAESGLVVLTWGNASGFDFEKKLVVIKPSGVSYEKMQASDMVVLNLDGEIVEGNLRPSSDTPTHIEFYKSFAEYGVGGAVHTHSVEATAWAQACREIPCYGTTHADLFHGSVPCTRHLTEEEVSQDYEGNTGKVVVELFKGENPLERPGVLVAGHAPFTWGKTADDAVDNAISLESFARMARLTEMLHSQNAAPELPKYVGEKHYMRKHGPNSYYGQN